MSILSRTQHMGVAALVLAGSVFISRFMGLVRDKVISCYYGAGSESDIYMASFVAPDFINYLLAGGYFSITLIPLLTRKFNQSKEEGWNFFSAVFWWVTIVSMACVGLAWIFAPGIAAYTAPGFLDRPEHLQRLTFFLRIILPAQAFFLPGACLTALLYWRRQFVAPALMPLIYNGCTICGGLVVTFVCPERGMEGFCWGVVVGSFLGAFALPLAVAWSRASGGLQLHPCFWNGGLKAFILMGLPLMLGQSIAVLDEQFIRVFGSLAGAGAVSLLSYARRFMLVPIGLVAQTAGSASYPFLAGLVAEGREDDFAATVQSVTRNALAVAVPICVCMAALAEPLIRLLFEQGKFTAADTHTCSSLLALMLPAVLFWVVHQMVSRTFYAHGDTLTPVLVGTASSLAFIPVYWGLVQVLGAYGVALAGVMGIGVYTVAMVLIWGRRHSFGAFVGLVPFATSSLALCALPGLAAWMLGQYCSGCMSAAPLLSAALALLVGGLAFAMLWLVLAKLFCPQHMEIFRQVWRKLVPRGKNS